MCITQLFVSRLNGSKGDFFLLPFLSQVSIGLSTARLHWNFGGYILEKTYKEHIWYTMLTDVHWLILTYMDIWEHTLSGTVLSDNGMESSASPTLTLELPSSISSGPSTLSRHSNHSSAYLLPTAASQSCSWPSFICSTVLYLMLPPANYQKTSSIIICILAPPVRAPLWTCLNYTTFNPFAFPLFKKRLH